jgi:hypothetical protein
MVTSGTLAKKDGDFSQYSLCCGGMDVLLNKHCHSTQSASVEQGGHVVRTPFSQESQVVGRRSCCQHEVCHRTFVGYVRCESVPPLLASLICGGYVKCCGVERPQVCWKGLSALTRSCIPTRVGSWELHEKKDICSKCQSRGSSRRS